MTAVNGSSSKKVKILCSFCGNPSTERKIIHGQSATICDECVETCRDLLNREDNEFNRSSNNFPTPQKIKEFLDDYVVGQDIAKRVLSVAVFNHYKRLRYQEGGIYSNRDKVELFKSNILLIGPTGSGKTLLAETLARMLNVPFAIADATTLTEAGYVGDDVESIIHKLLQNCDYDIEKAQSGIIYIDELDKISRKSDNPSISRDVSGEGVQQALLKLIEGTIAAVPQGGGRKHPQQELYRVNTTNILFICGGSFDGLEKIIHKRIGNNHHIGFTATTPDKTPQDISRTILSKLEPEDLTRYGLIPELVGRLPVVATLDQLDRPALINILTQPKNALIKQYEQLFKMENVDIDFQEDAIIEIATLALQHNTGARGLRAVVENLLLDVMYAVPSDPSVRKVVINQATVKGDISPIYVYAGKRTVYARKNKKSKMSKVAK